jgi:hypothetical protein
MNRTFRSPAVLAGIIFFCLLAPGCSREERPAAPSISDEQFIEFSAQSAVLTREGKLAGQDSLTIRRRLDSLKHAQRITEAQIEEAVSYYRYDLQRWESVTSRVVKRLEELQRKSN